MFGIAGATNASSAGGGGGGGSPFASFFDATSNYNTTSKVWTDPVDGGMQLVDGGTDPSGIDASNRVNYGSGARSNTGSALNDALAGLDDYSIVIGAQVNTGATLEVKLDGSSGNYQLVLASTSIYRAYDFRDSDLAQANGTGSHGGAFHVFRFVFRKGTTSITQIDDESAVVSAGSTADVVVVEPRGGISYVRANSAQVDYGFVNFYDHAISDEDYAALLATVTDNADYGAAGYTP